MKLSADAVRKIADEIDGLPSEADAYFNRKTGEVYPMIEDFDSFDEEDSQDLDGLPEWQREEIAKRRDVLNNDAWIGLPNSFDIHEWKLMEDFSYSVTDEAVREELLDAIRASGAFRRFKQAVDSHHRRDEWLAYKQECILGIVKSWLHRNDIEFED